MRIGVVMVIVVVVAVMVVAVLAVGVAVGVRVLVPVPGLVLLPTRHRVYPAGPAAPRQGAVPLLASRLPSVAGLRILRSLTLPHE